MSGLHIIWFRQDLRVHDHAALRSACAASARDGGEVLPLYVLSDEEPQQSPLAFPIGALRDLRTALDQKGLQLHLRRGGPDKVFSDFYRDHNVRSVHLHEIPDDDANLRSIEGWALRAGITLQVHSQYGPVLRPGDHRPALDDWSQYMAQPRFETPDRINGANVGVGDWSDLILAEDPDQNRGQSCYGGRRKAIESLREFLGTTADPSRIGAPSMSGATFYEQFEPYLVLGVISVREVWQAATSARQHLLKAGQEIRAASIESFIKRLPELYQAKYQRGQSLRGPRNDPGKLASDGQQLTLGL